MKKMNVKNVIAILSMVLVSAISNARDFSELVNVSAIKSEKKALIRVMNPTDKIVAIKVEDENGSVVFYEENFKDSAYAKILNLKNLEVGNYLVTIKSGKNIVEKTLVITENGVEIKTEKLGSFKVNFKSSENIFLVEVGKTDAVVKIYCFDALVYEDVVFENKIKGFDLNKLEKGVYTATISTDDNTYTYTLDVK